jgi:coenzyme F420-reducing hydrogenase delta subunit
MNQRPLKAHVFYCSHHVQARDFAALGGGSGTDAFKTIGLPCSGKVDIPYLMKSFETGADGVAVVTCQRDDCRYFEGSVRAQKRAEGVERLLGEIGLPIGRIAVFQCDQQETRLVLDRIMGFLETLRQLPPIHIASAATMPPGERTHEG